MSACQVLPAALVLPRVWAFANQYTARKLPIGPPPKPIEPHLAFYRKYTQALLRRYVRMSMEAGKVPSMLGQEILRDRRSNYRVDSFEDVVIYLADIDHCLAKLDPGQQHLIRRIAIEEFTVGEVSAALGLDPRTVIRRYGRAIDRLTCLFLSAKILEPLKCCQVPKSVEINPTGFVSVT